MSGDGGATPVDPDELDDLIPDHIGTRAELNEWEQTNILAALPWMHEQHRVLTSGFLLALHRRMFDQTWRWAGRYRQHDTNLGVAWEKIPTEVHQLLADVAYWREHATYPADEIGVRFHHRLVVVHPFVNGNGRHARLAADRLMRELGARPFTWGSVSLDGTGAARTAYLEALRAADRGDYTPLSAFVRT